MPTFMQSGAAWLGSQLKSSAGREVTIRRGGVDGAPLTGWCGAMQYEADSGEGFVTTFQGYDWGFVTADLPEGFTLRSGDLIVETIGAVEKRYEVLPKGNMPSVEETDSSGVMTTAHTKRVA